MIGTAMFHEMLGKDGGSEGIDNDYAIRSMEGFGAFIMGRNMFGPVRRDWPDDLVLDCHRKESGKSYGSIYGRMWWDQPSTTMTNSATP